jgi:hypothetical protein
MTSRYRQHLILTILPTGKTYCPNGYEFGAKLKLITWIVEKFLSASANVPDNKNKVIVTVVNVEKKTLA